MAMKKFINNPADLTSQLVEGFVLAHPDLVKLASERVVVRVQHKEAGKVGVVTMGGSGHEPALIGWVGKGLVDVCALGDVFAAPGAPRIIEAVKLADKGAGVILVTFNHEGDVLASNMALQMAEKQGIKLHRILASDDISSAPRNDPDNRRGLIGGLIIMKVVGAAAEAGLSFDEVVKTGEDIASQLATLSVAVSPATHPATGNAFFELPDDEMEVGMGQHGEAGTGRMKLKTADETADLMFNKLITDLGAKSGDHLVVQLNGTGATTLMEMFIIFRKISQIMKGKGLLLAGTKIGELLTVQEQGGFQMSIGRVNAKTEKLWKASCNATYYTVA